MELDNQLQQSIQQSLHEITHINDNTVSSPQVKKLYNFFIINGKFQENSTKRRKVGENLTSLVHVVEPISIKSQNNSKPFLFLEALLG